MGAYRAPPASLKGSTGDGPMHPDGREEHLADNDGKVVRETVDDMTLQDFAKKLLQELTAQLKGGCSTCGRTPDEPLDENERCCGCSDARKLIEQAKSFWAPASMLESEKDALRAMAQAAKGGKHGQVRLTRWDAKLQDESLGTTILRLVAWRGQRDRRCALGRHSDSSSRHGRVLRRGGPILRRPCRSQTRRPQHAGR